VKLVSTPAMKSTGNAIKGLFESWPDIPLKSIRNKVVDPHTTGARVDFTSNDGKRESRSG
jgi:hypothetical protein